MLTGPAVGTNCPALLQQPLLAANCNRQYNGGQSLEYLWSSGSASEAGTEAYLWPASGSKGAYRLWYRSLMTPCNTSI